MAQAPCNLASWPGLGVWRAKGLDEGRSWGARGPEPQVWPVNGIHEGSQH